MKKILQNKILKSLLVECNDNKIFNYLEKYNFIIDHKYDKLKEKKLYKSSDKNFIFKRK